MQHVFNVSEGAGIELLLPFCHLPLGCLHAILLWSAAQVVAERAKAWQWGVEAAAGCPVVQHSFTALPRHKYGAAIPVSGEAYFVGSENMKLLVRLGRGGVGSEEAGSGLAPLSS